jgi:hypothetical protein
MKRNPAADGAFRRGENTPVRRLVIIFGPGWRQTVEGV